MGDDGAVALASSPRLRLLELSGSNVGDRGFIALCNSQTRPVNTLVLNDCLVSDAGLDGAKLRSNGLSLLGSRVTEEGVARFDKRLPMAFPMTWYPRRRHAHFATSADLAPLATIGRDEDADSLWGHALTLAFSYDDSRGAYIRAHQIDSIFQAAVERSNRPAPILVAWGDSGPSVRSLPFVTQLAESELDGHPEGPFLKEALNSSDPQVACYAAAASLEPDNPIAFQRLAKTMGVRGSLEAFVRRDPENALAHYLGALALPDPTTIEERLAWLQRGHEAPRLEGYPTPFPSAIRPSAPPANDPADLAAGPFVRLTSVQYKFAEEYDPTIITYQHRIVGDRMKLLHSSDDPRLMRSMIRVWKRARDASLAADSIFFTGSPCLPIILDAAANRANAAGDAAALARIKKLQAGLAAVHPQDVTARLHDKTLRLHHLLPDLLAVRRENAVELRRLLAEHGLDGSLEWLAELFQ